MSKILWLASWYPDDAEPANGDFIRRHAQSVAAFENVHLVHVLQAGPRFKIHQTKTTVYKEGGLTEHIHQFAFHPTGFTILDKIRYHFKYHYHYKKFLKSFFKQQGKPVLIHVHVPMKAGMIARYCYKKWKIPYIVSEQATHYEKAAPDNFFRRSEYFKKRTTKIFQEAICVTNVSSTVGKEIQKIFGIRPVKTIHNLVDTDLFYYQPRLAGKPFRWLHVSALGAQKNPEGMLRAFSLLRQKRNDWECIVCGPAPAALIQMVSDMGMGHQVIFTGERAYQEIAFEMRQADAFVLFSNYENFPCVIIEALCSGLPVVCSNTGGVSEAITETNGYLIPPEDIYQLSDSLNKMMDKHPFFDREAISRDASKLYDKNVIAQQFLNLYKELI